MNYSSFKLITLKEGTRNSFLHRLAFTINADLNEGATKLIALSPPPPTFDVIINSAQIIKPDKSIFDT